MVRELILWETEMRRGLEWYWWCWWDVRKRERHGRMVLGWARRDERAEAHACYAGVLWCCCRTMCLLHS